MTDLLVDPRFWGALASALLVAFMIVLLVAGLRRRRQPEVIGAIRGRCEVCEDAWATPTIDPYDDLVLCQGCQRALDEARDGAEGAAL